MAAQLQGKYLLTKSYGKDQQSDWNYTSHALQDLSPDDKFGPFWNFTWWEMGSKDLPRVLEYILDLTGQNK